MTRGPCRTCTYAKVVQGAIMVVFAAKEYTGPLPVPKRYHRITCLNPYSEDRHPHVDEERDCWQPWQGPTPLLDVDYDMEKFP